MKAALLLAVLAQATEPHTRPQVPRGVVLGTAVGGMAMAALGCGLLVKAENTRYEIRELQRIFGTGAGASPSVGALGARLNSEWIAAGIALTVAAIVLASALALWLTADLDG